MMQTHVGLLLPLLVLSSTLVLQTTTGQKPLYKLCSPFGNYSSHGTYAQNLQELTAVLIEHAQVDSGFSIIVADRGNIAVSGLTLCRGDVGPSPCKACIVQAVSRIRQECPNQKQAYIWYENCMLRYSDQQIIGIVDDAKFHDWVDNAVPNPKVFNRKVIDQVNQVAAKAASQQLLFAKQQAKIRRKDVLYTLAQCTRDLSPANCSTCLKNMISQFPKYFNGKSSGRVLGGSCTIRYRLNNPI